MNNRNSIKITHCEEITVQPHIITLNNISIDIEKITVRDSTRMLDIIVRSETGDVTDSEIVSLIQDIIKKQCKGAEVPDLLDEGNMVQVKAFIEEVVKYTLRTYSPIARRHPELFRETPEGSPTE